MNMFRSLRLPFTVSLIVSMVGLVIVEGPLVASAQSSSAAQSDIEHNLRFQNVILGRADEGMALQQRMIVLHVPGVSIALIHRGKLAWTKGYGVVALGGAPVAPTTLFNAASMSKPLTAM